MADHDGMSVIVRVVTRWLFGLILAFGLAVAMTGHLTPGGGFAGGVVLAGGLVLLVLAFGRQLGLAATIGRLSSSLDAVGALGFLAMAVFGYLTGQFFERWITLGAPFTIGSTPFIVLMNVAILLKVAAGIFAGFLALVAFGRLAADREGGEK